MPNVDSLKITRDKFLALKWVSEPGRILEWLEAYKRRLDKLLEMKVLTKEDDFSSIVNSFRKAKGSLKKNGPCSDYLRK